jgi:hypothetical protein
MNNLKQIWAKSFQDLAFIDYRTLSLFRICFGLVLFFDLLTKLFDITAFYTDQGIYPRVLAIQDLGWWSVSFHMASGALWFQLALFLLGFILISAFTLGYQTRLAAVLTWIFFVSLQGRSHLILHSGDALIRLMLFWSMFLPLEARYSLDRLALGRRGRVFLGKGIASIATLAILLQLLSMYFFTAILKNHPDWNKDFLAVYYAVNLDQFTTPLGKWLQNFPTLLKLLTVKTYYLELIGPLLLLIPFIQKWARLVLPFAFIGLHLGLFLTMYLGLFPWMCMVAWILFFPSNILDFLEKILPKISFEKYQPWIVQNLPTTIVWKENRLRKILSATFVLVSLVSVLAWNIITSMPEKPKVPQVIRNYVLPIRLDQYWSMFAPYPMRGDGWFVVDGKLKDGSNFDTWNHMPPPWDKPDNFFPLYRSTQWRKYLTNVWVENKEDSIRLAFGKYVCREWNNLSGQKEEGKILESYQLYYMRENTPLPGNLPEIKKVFLWNHNCFGDPEPVKADLPPPVRD